MCLSDFSNCVPVVNATICANTRKNVLPSHRQPTNAKRPNRNRFGRFYMKIHIGLIRLPFLASVNANLFYYSGFSLPSQIFFACVTANRSTTLKFCLFLTFSIVAPRTRRPQFQ